MKMTLCQFISTPTRLRWGLLGLLVVLTASHSLWAQCFSTRADYSVGSRPNEAIVGDVNADGRPDIITVNFYSANVTVLLAQAGGGYARTDYAVGNYPSSLVLGDANADGRYDIVTTNNSGSISLLLGQAGGGYVRYDHRIPGEFGVYEPSSIALGDLNKDGREDLILGSDVSDIVVVLLGVPEGPERGYAVIYLYNLPGYIFDVVVADMNKDGLSDIIVATFGHGTGNVSVLLSDGTGGFTRQNYNSPFSNNVPTSLNVADMNRDGRLDIVTAVQDKNLIMILVAQAGGGYAPTEYPGDRPSRVATADLNADGRLDMVANSANGKVSVLLAQVTGGYARTDYEMSDYPSSVTVGEVNRDGRPDIVATTYYSDGVAVLLNTNATPVITRQPASSSAVCAGQTVTVPASVSGTPTSTQWYKDGSAVSGQTSATLTLPNTTTANSGSYVLVVSNCNSVTSTAFTLTVDSPTLSLSNDGPLTCTQPSVRLFAIGSSAGTYAFRAPDGSLSSNGNTARVSSPGTYTVTFTSTSTLTSTVGCSATATTTVTSQVISASLTNNGPLSCVQTSVTLTASPSTGVSYAFSGPGVLTSSGNTATVSQPGTYSVVVTNPQGCSASAQTSVTGMVCLPTGPSLSGNVFNDTNALSDNIVNGPGVNGPTLPVYVSLVESGTLTATTPVTSTGTYSFSQVANGSYRLVLTTKAAGSLTPSVPSDWANTGEAIGTGVGSDGSADGLLEVTVAGAPVNEANFGIRMVPDLTAVIHTRPTTVYNTTNIMVVVDMVEINNVPTSGLITIKIPKDPRFSLSMNPGATSVNGRVVQNSAWNFTGPSGGFYTLTTTNVVAGNIGTGSLSFGLSGTLTPGATTGTLTVSAVIVGGSGGEVRIDNDNHTDKIDYFPQ